MTKKVIAVDLDGTLLDSNSQLSDFTKETIKRISAKGHKVVITTGRPYRMALKFYKELELNTPMINFNGALTHLPEKKWPHEQSLTLDKSFLLDMVERKEEIEADFIAGEYRNKFYITDPNEKIADPKLFGIENFKPENQFQSHLVTENPNAILLQTRANDKYALAEEMNAFYQHELSINTWGGPLNILECAPKGVNKAFALQYLLNLLNVDRQHLIAFGDEHNDTEMLSFAGTGYAMKNASTDLLPYADRQLDFTNDQDGVAHELNKLFL
ncbi:Cof-type HAD-IIB family hydrolase [Streptococcus panodentis]|uniref:HAD family hydrolase n=1 Tax=Streptococcus panodentis TaxID=1581472 RepID=A0ABS5AY89_9STRE|nr:Cof-type HAD-IIB family hydrolase [Streptococcus panodentis]MBP2621396.1 HAD family hydrolase [Streptococcus panodentis]